MAKWEYRQAWTDDYKAFKKSIGADEPKMAELLGVKLDSLANYKRPNGSRPTEDFLRRSARLFGQNPYRYMPDPRVKDGLAHDIPGWVLERLQRNARAMDGSKLDPKQWDLLLDNMLAQARALESLLETAKTKKK